MEAGGKGKGGSEWSNSYIRPLQLDSHTLFPSQSAKGFSNLICTIGSWTAGSLTHPSFIFVTIHPRPDIETKKLPSMSSERSSQRLTLVRRTVRKTKNIFGGGEAVEWPHCRWKGGI